jgi:ABC transporter DrrB family efflux protein
VWAMILKEFRQVRRDRRTLAMMIVLPVLLLVVFGYAASFDVDTVATRAYGPGADQVAAALPDVFDVGEIERGGTRTDAEDDLRNARAAAAVVTDGDGGVTVLLDGAELFTANAARTALASQASTGGGTAGPAVEVDVLFNQDLDTSTIMVPGLAGLILLFIGTVVTSLGVVRERQAGTLEQLAVMPLRPRDVFLGKIAPYFLVAAVDLALVLGVGVPLFGVPFRGSLLVLALGALLFLFVTLGMGVLISSVSENQGQAIQLAIMALLPQVLLSGLIFPVSSMAPGVRWIAYLLPLTYFTQISRGVMIRGTDLAALWQPFVYLTILGVAVVVLATLRFRRDLAPAPPRRPRVAAAVSPPATGKAA